MLYSIALVSTSLLVPLFVSAFRRAEELVAKMTVEEAASQLRYDSPAIERLGIPEYRMGEEWFSEHIVVKN